MNENDFKRIETMMAHQLSRQLGVVEENIQHKLGLVIEGQQMLAERVDRMGEELRHEIRTVDTRLTGIAADLSAHRADTEAHHGLYRVRE